MAPRRPSSEKTRLKPALRALARAITRQPWNRPGTDKTWVLRSHYNFRSFLAAVSRAKRV